MLQEEGRNRGRRGIGGGKELWEGRNRGRGGIERRNRGMGGIGGGKDEEWEENGGRVDDRVPYHYQSPPATSGQT